MADGATKTLYDHRPCRRCGGRVKLIGGRCDDCDQKHLRPQPGPQTDFLSCKADIALTGGGMGSGKAAKLTEPVPTPNGWSTVGELRPGDVIFGEHGQPVVVTLVHPIDFAPESYRVTFNDGSTIDVCGDHLWLTFDLKDRKALIRRDDEWRAQRRAIRPSRAKHGANENRRAVALERNKTLGQSLRKAPPTGTVRTTRQIAATLKTSQGYLNHAVPIAGSLQLPDADLPIPPYLLGAWLGDGDSHGGMLTSADDEIVEHIRSLGFDIYQPPFSENSGKSYGRYRIRGLTSRLRQLGVINNKHIPIAYRRASHFQRLELLRGLMDTDGHAQKNGRTEFVTTVARLRDDFEELVASLGMRFAYCEGRATLNGKDCGPKYRFTVYADEQIFRLTRKVERFRLTTGAAKDRRKWRYIENVERIDPVPMRCITVDNPTGLWLVGRRHLVTHNTFSLLLDWGRYINTPGANGLIVRNRSTDITVGGGLWDEARNVYEGTGARPRGGSLMDITWPSGAKLSFRHLDDRNVERFKGPGFSWIAFEEVNECPWDAVMWLLSRNRSTCGARPVVRMSTNPDPDHPILDLVDPYLFLDPDHPLYGYPDRSKSGMVVYLIRGSDDRFIIGSTPEEVAAKTDSDPALALSFSFIPSLLEDNRALAETDPKYRAKFGAMTAVDRARNERGNWKIRAQVHGMIRLHWIPVIERPLAPILHRVRAWDMASTRPGPKNKDPDFTIGMLIGWDIHGRWYVMDMVACREEAPEVLKLMAATAASDGPDVTQVIEIEGGAAGKHSQMQWTATLRSSGRCGPVVPVSRLGDKVVKVTPVADQLRLGMNGPRPRLVDYEQDPTGEWSPRGFQTGTWRSKPYKDAGQHPPTLGALFDQQVEAFFRPDVHDDVPDVMAIAHAARQQPKVKYEDPVQRMIRQS